MNPLLTKIAAMFSMFDTTELYRDIRPAQSGPTLRRETHRDDQRAAETVTENESE